MKYGKIFLGPPNPPFQITSLGSIIQFRHAFKLDVFVLFQKIGDASENESNCRFSINSQLDNYKKTSQSHKKVISP